MFTQHGVKYFFESLTEHSFDDNKKVVFIVQSGFPEAKHSLFVKKYLERFASRLKCQYLGTIIKGGVEGIQVKPPAMNRGLYEKFRKLGFNFAINGNFDPVIMKKMSRPYQFTTFGLLFFKFFSFLGLTNFYWNSMLKKHGAYAKRFDRPYLKAFSSNPSPDSFNLSK